MRHTAPHAPPSLAGRSLLTATVFVLAAACGTGPQSLPDDRGAFGKADGFGSDTRGPGCATVDNATYGYLVAKLHDDLGVELRAGADQFELTGQMSEAMEEGLTGALENVLDILSTFDRDIGDVRMMFAARAPVSLAGAPKLAGYYQIQTRGLERAEIESLCAELGTSPIVELAYPQPRPELALASEGIDLTSDDRFTPFFSNYLASASEGGFGAAPVRALAGAKGEGVRIVDLEFGAALDHEDFPDIEFVGGDANAFNDHGTAVLGVIGAQTNDFGTEGIVPQATLGSTAWSFQGEPDFSLTIAELITQSADWAGPGGILLIEMHAGAQTQFADCSSNCNPGQCNFVPMEYFPAIFDAIAAATASGVHVVEAAGNGAVDLDAALPDRRLRDSGAILVGASLSTERAPACFTNHGEAIDVHGWGENVLTAGYGNHPVHNEVPVTSNEDSYTHTFSGTSSASPLVVGSAGSILGLVKAQLDETILPGDLRDMLARTGTRQTSTSPPDHPERFFLIGAQPDIEAAWETFQQLIPIAAFDHAQPQPLTVSFTNQSLARSAALEAEIAAVQWDFGDGDSTSTFSPTHTYRAAGDYRVTLSVFSLGGFTRTATAVVTVAPDPTSQGRDAAVIELVNTTTLAVLDDDVPLASDAARNLIELRPFETIGEILAVPRVGPKSLQKLYDFVAN